MQVNKAACATILALIVQLAQCPELFAGEQKSRLPDPPLGAKSKDFASQVGLWLALRDVPGKDKSSEKAAAKLKEYEKNSWKGLAEILERSFVGKPLPGSGKRTMLKPVDGLPVVYYFGLPGGYNPGKSWPLCIALHGGGAGAGDGTEAMSTFGDLMRSKGAIAAAPTAPELLDGAWNCPRGYRVVRALIEEIGAHYNVDWNKIYVGGHSMGGYGSFFEAAYWPDRFAAHLSSAGGISAGCVCDFEGLYNTPVWVVHGTEDDRQAPIAFVRAADKSISLMKLKPRAYVYKEIQGAGHGLDYGTRKEAADWMWKQVRDPYPKKVVCLCPTYWDTNPGREMGGEKTGRAFWIEVIERNGNTFDQPAKVVGELGPDPNTITLTTPQIKRILHKGPGDVNVSVMEMNNCVSKIGICLTEDFVDLSKPVKIMLNGRVAYDDFVNRSAEYLLDHLARTGDPGMPFCARVVISAP